MLATCQEKPVRLIERLKQALDPLHDSSPTTRAHFAAWYRHAKVAQIRYVAFLTMVLYLVYAAIELNVADDAHGLRLLLHGGVIPGLLLATGLMSFRPALRRPMIALLMTAPIFAVAVNLHFNYGHPDFAHFAPELYLNLIWTFAISGLRLRQALLTASASALMILLVSLSDSLQPGVQRLHLIWILASFSFGLLCAQVLEKAHKDIFLQHRRLALSASIDGLTGLWNRARIDQFFAGELARAQRYGTPFSLILMDIDHFKDVNDSHGHTVGDSVLRQFATLLRQNVRAVDKVGRLGGEEFLIVLPQVDAQQARNVALLLQQHIRAFSFDTVEHKTASFGVTQFAGDQSPQAMLDRVDRALYLAKAGGRDRIEVL